MTNANDSPRGAAASAAPRRPSRPVIVAVVIGAVVVLGGGTAWAVAAASTTPASGPAQVVGAGTTATDRASIAPSADAADSPAPGAPDTTSGGAQEDMAQQAEQQAREDDERIARGAEAALAAEQFRADIGSTRAALGAGADLAPLLDRLHADSGRVQSTIVGASPDGAALDAFGEVERALDALTVATTTSDVSAPAALQSLEDAVLRLSSVVQNPR